MPKFNYTHALVQLIASLDKAEKRYFKLYSKRSYSNDKGLQFILLFDVVDKYQAFHPKALEKTLPGITSKQLSDLKRHLYGQLLESLRMYNAKGYHFQLASKVDTARILYSKGLFLDSLEILKKAKPIARSQQKHLLVNEIIDLEREIESRHVTRSHATRAEELGAETDEVRELIQSESDWSQFSLNLYAKFLQIGHVKNQDEFETIHTYFEVNKPRKRSNSSSYFFESLYREQAYAWYYYITQNFVVCYRHNKAEVDLFEQFPSFKGTQPGLLIKALHNCLSVLYYCFDEKRHEQYLNELQAFFDENGSRLNYNNYLMAFIYLNSARLNGIILSGKFTESMRYLKDFEGELNQLSTKIDDHRLMVFWYKMASIYFTVGEYNDSLRLLNKIINPNQRKLREDVQCFARLLNLIVHFELQNEELLGHLIKSTYRFLLKLNEVTKLHRVLIHFMKNSLYMNKIDQKKSFILLKRELEQLREEPYENRSFLYLDIISWLESKIENKQVESIINKKRKQPVLK